MPQIYLSNGPRSYTASFPKRNPTRTWNGCSVTDTLKRRSISVAHEDDDESQSSAPIELGNNFFTTIQI